MQAVVQVERTGMIKVALSKLPYCEIQMVEVAMDFYPRNAHA